MFKNYLKTALVVFRRRKFFTFVSLFGITVTLALILVAAAMLDHIFAGAVPEVYQDRTLGIYRLTLTSADEPSYMASALPAEELLDRYLGDLPGAEKVSISSVFWKAVSYVEGRRIVSFIVLFAVTATFLVFLSRVQRPMGFSYDALYTAAIDHRDFDLGEAADLQCRRDLMARLLDELETLPGAEAVAAASFSPFELAYSTSELVHEGASVSADRSSLTDGGLEALELEIVRGRWFEKADDALDWTPVVINQVAVDRLFKGQDPIGKTVNEDNDWRVVGVIRAYRKNGALSGINPSVILRVSLDRAFEVAPPQRFLIRVSPGTGGEIEERVLDLMRALAPEWTFQIEPTDSIRRRNGRMAATPLVLGAMVAGFLLVTA